MRRCIRGVITVSDEGAGKIILSGQGTKCLLPFSDPLTPRDREDLRWYLEDFRKFPYGGDAWRAGRIQEQLAIWGRDIFEQLFGGAGAEVFRDESNPGLEHLNIAVRSNDPRFLSVPWELICSPDNQIGYLALRISGLYRQRILDTDLDPDGDLSGGRLRMLLVISRPTGLNKIPLGSVAGPIMDVVRPLRGFIEVDVLRPATFENFRAALNGGSRYQVVHFDGHGEFLSRSEQFPGYSSDRGYLLFENEGHECDPIPSDRIAAVIPPMRAPLFILNACRSAREGDLDPFASVAAQLVMAGCPGVLAMSFSVYARTVERFMASFYRSLLEGSPVVIAATAGRKAVKDHDEGEAQRRGFSLHDWIVPAIYVQRPGLYLVSRKDGLPSITTPVVAESHDMFARDEEILRIDRALLDSRRPVLFLTGVIGEGKTKVAKSFSRWYRETGGSSNARYIDLSGESDLAAVFRAMVAKGRNYAGTEDIARAVSAHLRNTTTMVVWDHPEAIIGYGQGNEKVRNTLRAFFESLSGGRGRLVIVTRQNPREWALSSCQTITIGDLPNEEVAAELLEATAGLAPGRAIRRLIHAIGWHAGTLRGAITLLAKSSTADIADRLERGVPQPEDPLLDPDVQEAFDHLSVASRTHLPLLGLFGRAVIPWDLGIFTGRGMKRNVYRELCEQSVSGKDWETILEETADAGLARNVQDGGGIFEVPANVRYFLRGRLKEKFGERLELLREGICAFYGGLAMIWCPMLEQRDSGTQLAAAVEEGGFTLALDYAIAGGHWKYADGIFRLFRQRFEEQTDILERIIRDLAERIEPGFPRSTEELHFWCSIRSAEAYCAEASHQFDVAEQIGREVLERIEKRREPEFLPRIASCLTGLAYRARERNDNETGRSYFTRVRQIAEQTGDKDLLVSALHGLGSIAQATYDLDSAAELFREAMLLNEAGGDLANACNQYHHLGMLAKARGRLDEAEDWFLRGLRIRERLNIRGDAASDRFLLGEVAESRGDLRAACRWFRAALGNYMDLGLDADAASAAQRLAMILEQLGEHEEAVQWCRWVLPICKKLRLRRLEAHVHHELGIIAIKSGDLQNAREEFQRARDIYEDLDSIEHVAGSHLMLGSVARAEDNFKVAREEFSHALEKYEILNHPPLLQKPLAALGEIAALEGENELAIKSLGRALEITRTWRLPDESQILTILAQALDRLGDGEFQALWEAAGLGSAPLETLRAVQRGDS